MKMTGITIIKTDITQIEADAIVNATNEALLEGSGSSVSSSIFTAAGYKEMTDACRAIGHCDIGGAVITPGFRLKAHFVIHAVGPMWDGGGDEEIVLARTCEKCLSLAKCGTAYL